MSATTIAEQIALFETKRKAAQDKASAIVQKGIEEGRTLDAHETEQHKEASAEVSSIDAHLKLLGEHQALMASQAKTVPLSANQAEGASAATVPGTGLISVRRNLPPGIPFTRFAMACAVSKGNLMQAEILAGRWKDTPEVAQVLKTAVAAGTTSDSAWAGPLVQYQDMVSEFIAYLRPRTMIDRLDQVRRVPFNIRVPRQTAGITGSFVGEGAPTPVNKLQFDNVTLPWSKASTIVVLTVELARLSSPSAEALVRDDLVAGIAQYLDKRLVDPAYPGVSGTSPASLTNGVTPTLSTGSTLAALDKDVRTVMTQFADAELGLMTGVWLMSASLAIRLSMMRTNQDIKAFPELTVKGGTFYGLPVIVSNNVTGSGSPGDQFLILMEQNEIMLADDGQMTIDASSEASVQLNDAPSAGAQSLVSLWQNGLLGLKVDRWIHWTKRRSTALQFIDKAQSYSS